MKLFVVACLLASAYGGRLENVYLPPTSANSAGGSNFLGAPAASYGTPAPVYGTPSPSYGTPAPSYGAPGYSAADPNANARILKYNNDNNGDGSYSYSYETDNHIRVQEQGSVKQAGSEPAVVAQGGFAFSAPDGNTYTIEYVADENGFQPRGAHLPTPPPIPEAILKSLEINAAAEAARARSGPYPSAAEEGGYPSENPNNQYLAPQPVNRQYLAPRPVDRQYLAPQPVNRQYLAPQPANRQYLAPQPQNGGYRY